MFKSMKKYFNWKGKHLMSNFILIIFIAISLTISIFSFMQKGPIFSTIYFFSTEKEKKELKTKDRYYFIGITFLVVSIIFAITFMEDKVNVPFLWIFRAVIIIGLCIYTITRYSQLESKRIKNKS